MAEGIPTKLTTLKGLTDEGVLTEDEFVERKTNLLDVYCDVEPTYAPVTKEERRGCLGLTSFGQTFAASSIGNICEWYDFAAFAGLADILGTKLFPPQSKTEAFAVFGAAFFMRPLGGAIFGYLGDTVGRKQALEWSIMIMVIPSFCIGLIPTYDQVGFFATLLLVALRLIQGVAVGGELVTAYTFVAEHAPNKRDAPAWTGLVLDTANCGTLSGIATVAIFRLALSEQQMRTTGWRIVFFLGLPVGLAGLRLRKHVGDSPEFLKELDKQHHKGMTEKKTEDDDDDAGPVQSTTSEETSSNPLKLVYTTYRSEVLMIAGIASMWCGGFYATFVWMTFYYSYNIAGLRPVDQGPAINAGMLAVLCLLFIPMAYTTRATESSQLQDTAARRALKRGQLGLVVSAIPVFALIGYHRTPAAAIFGQFLFGLCLASFGAGLPFFLVHAFPLRVRVAAIGAAYNISQAIFGGGFPLIMTALLDVNLILPGVALVVLALFSFSCLSLYEYCHLHHRYDNRSELELVTVSKSALHHQDNDVGLC